MDVISFKRLSLSFKRLSSRNFLICIQALFTHSAEVAALWDSIIAPSTSPHFRCISPTSKSTRWQMSTKVANRMAGQSQKWLVNKTTRSQNCLIMWSPVLLLCHDLTEPHNVTFPHSLIFQILAHDFGDPLHLRQIPPFTHPHTQKDGLFGWLPFREIAWRLILFLLATQPFPSL